MSRLIPAFEQFFDSSGNPLENGLVDFFESGSSSVRKTTYADSGEKIPNANPVVLNGDGRCPNVFGSGTYRAVLKDSDGNQILYRDPIGGDQNLAFGADWSSIQIYSTSDVVRDAGEYWESLSNNNLNNRPSIDDGSNWRNAFLTESEIVNLSGKVYGTVAVAKADPLYSAGQKVATQGYYTAGDGGEAGYIVVAIADYVGTPDGYGDHATDDGDFVLVLQENGTANVLAWGATPNEIVTDYDNTLIFQAIADDADTAVVQLNLPPGIGEANFKSGQILAKQKQLWRGLNSMKTKVDFSLASAGEDGFLVTGGVSNYLHGSGFFNLGITGAPRHGIYVDTTVGGGVGENFTIDLVQSNNNGGDGVNFSGDSTPLHLGHLSVHSNGGTGLRIKGEGQTFVQVQYLAGDNNVESLCTMEDVSTETNIDIIGWKSERWGASPGHDNIFKFVNANNGCANIGPGRYTSQDASAPNAVIQVVSGSGINLNVEPIATAVDIVADYAYMLENLITSQNYTPAQMRRKKYVNSGVLGGPTYNTGQSILWSNNRNSIAGVQSSNVLRFNHANDGASTTANVEWYNNTTLRASLSSGGNWTATGKLISGGDVECGGNMRITGNLGVGNSVAATTPGSVTNKIEVFDEAGVSIGFIAVYAAIT